MKNIFDVLKQKEDELHKLQTEVDALRIAARLLSDEEHAVAALAAVPKAVPVFRQEPAIKAVAAAGGYSAAWGNTQR